MAQFFRRLILPCAVCNRILFPPPVMSDWARTAELKLLAPMRSCNGRTGNSGDRVFTRFPEPYAPSGLPLALLQAWMDRFVYTICPCCAESCRSGFLENSIWISPCVFPPVQ